MARLDFLFVRSLFGSRAVPEDRPAGGDLPDESPEARTRRLEVRMRALERELLALRWLALVTTLALLLMLNEQLSPLRMLGDALGAMVRWVVIVAVLGLVGWIAWRWWRARAWPPGTDRYPGDPPAGSA